MPTLSPSQLSRLLHQYTPVLALFTEQPESLLRERPQPEKWSAMEQVAHMGRYTEYFLENRLAVLLSQAEPVFGRYRAEEDADFALWLQVDKKALLDQFYGQRQHLYQTLRALPESELSRRGSHPVLGLLTVPEWIEFFLLHEAHHLYALFWLLHTTKKWE